MIDVTMELPIEPMGKGRPRIGRGAGGHPVAITPPKTRAWEALFADLVASHLPATPIESPVRVDILAVLPRPGRLMRVKDAPGLVWAPTKPDEDNIRKAVLDGLKRHLRDDKQVVCGGTVKVYAEKAGLPRTIVRVREVDADGSPAGMIAAFGLGGEL